MGKLQPRHESKVGWYPSITHQPVSNSIKGVRITCVSPLRKERSDDDVSISEAKRLIETYCENEFQSPADFSDIRNIGLAYTTITEEEIEIQVNANLEDSSIDTYLDGILIRKSAYPSIKDLVKEELSSLSFNSLIEYSDQEIETLHTAFSLL